MATASIIYAFNHEQLNDLMKSAPDTSKITFALVNIPEKSEMYACAFVAPATRPLTPLDTIGCPYPPGWGTDTANHIIPVETVNNGPAFLIAKEKLKGILDLNQLFIRGIKQLLIILDSDIINGNLVIFFRVCAYNADMSIRILEEKTEIEVTNVLLN
jgi:hypothetical protein